MRPSVRRLLSAVIFVLFAVAGLAAGFRFTDRAAATPAPNAPALGGLVPRWSVVATARVGSIPLYPSPGAAGPSSVVTSPDALGVSSVFLVRSQQGSWLNVYVPRRPNGSSAWIPAQDVTLARDPYAVTVSLTRHVLTAWKAGVPVLTTPAAVGKASTATPAGTFFLTELLRQPNPRGAYGPYAFGTSAFSDELFQFGGGPGQIGLHGTDEAGSIGGAVSHGCIRVADPVITRLAGLLPLGTPVLVAA